MRLVAVLVALVLLAGCAGEGDPASETNSESSGPPEAQTYGTVESLKDAAIEAGYVCDEWVQDNVSTLAAESGHCSDADVFATFASAGDLQGQLSTDRELNQLLEESGLDPDPVLVGPNWTIKGPHADALADALGGTVSQ